MTERRPEDNSFFVAEGDRLDRELPVSDAEREFEEREEAELEEDGVVPETDRPLDET